MTEDEIEIPKRESNEKKPIDLDQIERDELAYQEQIRLAKEEVAQEELRQANLKVKAGQDYGVRTDFMNQLKEIEAGIEEAHANQILERMAQADTLRDSQKSKQAELDGYDKVYVAAQEALSRIEKLISEADPEKGVSHQTEEVYEIVKKEYDEVVKNQADIIAEIEQINNQLISDETLAKYNALVESQLKLKDELEALEENPELVEILVSETKNENELRQKLKQKAIFEVARNGSPERQDFVEKIVDQFLTEEFEARGIDNIKNHTQKKLEMDAIVNGIMEGFNIDNIEVLIHGYQIPNFDDKKDKIYAGKLLQNLIGGYGTGNGTTDFAEWTISGINTGKVDYVKSQKSIASAIKIHLGTFNFIRANAIGFGQTDFGNKITVGFENSQYGGNIWPSLENKLRETRELKIDYNQGPILPIDATPAQENKIKKEYEANLKAAQELVQVVKEKKEKARLDRITQIENEIQQIKDMEKKIEEIDAQLNDWGELAPKMKKYDEMSALRRVVEEQISTNEASLLKAGWQSVNYKGKLNNTLTDLKARLKAYKTTIDILDKDTAQITNKHQERMQIIEERNKQNSLADLEAELRRLKS